MCDYKETRSGIKYPTWQLQKSTDPGGVYSMPMHDSYVHPSVSTVPFQHTAPSSVLNALRMFVDTVNMPLVRTSHRDILDVGSARCVE